MSRIPVAIIGATGAVGQRFVQLLAAHPTFEVAELVGKTSAGKRYGDAVNWVIEGDVPEVAASMDVVASEARLSARVVFSAIPSGEAGPIEGDLAKKGKAVFTNARDHRMEPSVPLVIPDINPDHLKMVEGRDGYIVANPNCSAVVLTTALKPLEDAFGLERVHVTTLQALSGAGYPGVPSLDSTANVVPYIGGEEEKIENEPKKVLGTLRRGAVAPLDVVISATATRVPVLEGHTCVVSTKLRASADVDAVAEAFARYEAPDPVPKLPSAARRVITVRTEPDRPQPRRDALTERGMGIVVGRIREDPLTTVKFVALGSNTIRGAAGCSVLNAELAHAYGYV